MSTQNSLPDSPNLAQLKNQARTLQRSVVGGEPSAFARVEAHHPRYVRTRIYAEFTLADAQLVVARENGSDSWPKLKARVESAAEASPELIERFKTAVEVGDAGQVGRLFRQNPALAKHVDAPLFNFGAPAIVRAAIRKDRKMIGVLLKAGANIDARSDWSPGSWSALDQADHQTAKYLGENGASFTIHSAAKHGMTGMVRQMLLADAGLAKAPGGDGATPLHFAGKVDICRLVLDYGADVDARDLDHGSTALQWSLDNPAKVRFLVENGATPDIFAACYIGDSGIAALVLERDPDCLSSRIGNPPFVGAASDHIYMYTRGVGPTARPLHVAADRGHSDLVSQLLPYASPPAKLIYACRTGDDDLIQSVLTEHPSMISAMEPDDRGAIADMGWENRPDAIARMLDVGFDIDWHGRESGTALERAAIRGWPDTVRYLISRGASMVIPNKYGGAPLGAAVWGSLNWDRAEADYAACVDALVAAGSPLPDKQVGSEAVQSVLRRYGVKD